MRVGLPSAGFLRLLQQVSVRGNRNSRDCIGDVALMSLREFRDRFRGSVWINHRNYGIVNHGTKAMLFTISVH